MSWKQYGTLKDKDLLDEVNMRPTITMADVQRQCLLLLHQTGVKWFPYVGRKNLVSTGQRPDGKFIFFGLKLPYSSHFLPKNCASGGAKIINPVDGSLFFKVTMMVADYLDRKRELLSSPQCKEKWEGVGKKWSRREFVGHILFHMFVAGNPPAIAEYKNLAKYFVLESGLLLQSSKRGQYVAVSQKQIWSIYNSIARETEELELQFK